ncbi:hypothetical protein M9H77_22113 [Catharanthus roseus]|uniref:Uncharacterized protein n=1 Tax=Catharanthus roseus TaxID=4058 RepID=A0ACC0AR14_CATRO|nr:hypothetical protein M9H77_22113 [Catharanthus roseus]
MEDENRLDLSLGLPCGGNTTASKGKISSTSDSRSDINDRDSKVINEFKQFLDGGTTQIGAGMVSLRKPENFFNLSNNPVDIDTSKNLSSGAFWKASDRPAEVREDRPDVREKRKSLFPEASQSKKHEKETDPLDLPDKSRASHISMNTDDGSTAENEDVADSEAEASTSRHRLQQEDVAKRYIGNSSLPEVNKDYHGISHSNVLELSGQKRFTISSEKEFKHGNLPHGVQFANQSVNIINMSRPLSIADSNTNAVDKENPRMVVSHHQQIHPSYISRGPPNLDKHSDDLKIIQGMPSKSSEPKQHDGKVVDYTPVNGKQLAEGGTSRTEDDKKGSNAIFRAKDATETTRTEGLPSEYPTIKPGIAAELKFGGSGSYPNLPWVSTTGSGPNGRTISGVTYRFSPTQIKIVCACHGIHMSPEEFVRHASEEQTNQDTGAGLASVPNTNPAASAQG